MNKIDIHTDFANCFQNSENELLSAISELQKKDRSIEKYTVFNELSAIGFRNSKTVVKAKKLVDDRKQTSNNLSALKSLQKQLEEIKVRYPYNIITYSQIISILEKYNLYIGHSTEYKDILPTENGEEIIKYSNVVTSNSTARDFFYGPSYNTTERSPYIVGRLDKTLLICAQEFVEQKRNHSLHFNFYVCAPHEMFNQEHRFIIGREMYYNPNYRKLKTVLKKSLALDPIILHPIHIDNPIARQLKLFHIVTSWGPGAKESEIVNEKI